MMTGESSLPGVIVVGDPRIHVLISQAPAQWSVQSLQKNVAHMWESLSGGRVDSGSRIVIFTDFNPDGTPVQESELLAIARAMTAMNDAGASVFHISGSVSARETISGHLADLSGPGALNMGITGIEIDAKDAPGDHVVPAIQSVVNSFVEFGVRPDSAGASEVVQTVEVERSGFGIPSIPALPPIGKSRAASNTTPRVSQGPALDVENHESRELLSKPRLPGQTTITVTSSKGGSGKSTASILLAASIVSASRKAGKPLSVCLVDLDTRDGQVASMIGQFMPTALNIRIQPIWDEERIRRNLVHAEGLEIDTLLAPIRPRTAETVGPDFYRSIVRSLQRMYDVVVMDTSVQYLDPLIAEVALVEADEILFVTSLASTAVQGMARALREITAPVDESGLGIPREKLGIIVNQSVANVGMETDQVLAAGLGIPVVGVIPLATKDVLTATNLIQMHKLLEHTTLGAAYNDLAIACMPNHELAPWVAPVSRNSDSSPDTSTAMTQSQTGSNSAGSGSDSKKRGFLRR